MERTNLELVLQKVLRVGHLAIQAEDLLLLLGEFLRGATSRVSLVVKAGSLPLRRVARRGWRTHADVNLVPLMRIHRGGSADFVSCFEGSCSSEAGYARGK